MVNKLDPQEVTSNPCTSSQNKQRCTEVTTNNQYIAKVVVVDEHNLKFTGGNYLEIESSIVKSKNLDTGRYKYDNFYSVYGTIGECKHQIWSAKRNKLNGCGVKEILTSEVIDIVD